MLYLDDRQLEEIALASGWGGEIKNYFSDYLLVVDSNFGALKTDAVMKRRLDYALNEAGGGLFSKLTLSYAHAGQADWKTSAYKSYTRVYVPRGSRLIDSTGVSAALIASGEEFGKTYFGFYFEVPIGQIKNITINYKLPPAVKTSGSYGLYIQKQPGKELSGLAVDLKFENELKSYEPTGLATRKAAPGELRWEGDLMIDRSFALQF